MFGRAVACAALLCALSSMVVAEEASAPARRQQFVRQLRSHLSDAQARGRAMAQQGGALERCRPAGSLWHSGLIRRSGEDSPTTGQRFGAQFMVDPAIRYGAAPSLQSKPAVAFDGGNYLVVWTDFPDTLSGTSVLGARVTQDGRVIDGEGITIDPIGINPSVGFDGTNYLVVDCGAGVRGFRVGRAGQVYDSVPIRVSPGDAWHQALAFDGNNYLVVWEDYRDSVSQIYGARVAPDGSVLDTGGFAIGTGPSRLICPSISFDGWNFLVVWARVRDSADAWVCGAWVSPDGQMLDTAFVVDSASGIDDIYGPTTTSDGTNSLVVWHDLAVGLRGALVAWDGTVVGRGIAIAPADAGYAGHSTLYDGSDYFVAWKARSPVDCILASRVSRQGVPLDTPGVYVSAPTQGVTANPAVAFGGNRYLVAWDDDRFGFSTIYAGRLTREMGMLDTTGIGIVQGGVNVQYGSATAFDGTNYLVAWTDTRNLAEAIVAARVSPGGANLDPAGIPICTLGLHREYASAAFDGTNYLVMWADGRRSDSADIYAARVTGGGSVLDPQGIPLVIGGDHHIFPTAAFNGTDYLLVWDDIIDASTCTIRCARISPNGRVLDTTGISICTETSAWMPVVAANGADWLVAWHDWRNRDWVGVYAARVNAAGQLLDSGGFALGPANVKQGCVALASDGTDYLAVWERLNDSLFDVRGARISTAGVLLDSFTVQDAVDTYATPPSAGFDGTNYGVVWVDSSWNSIWGIRGARISPSGEVINVSRLASSLEWRTFFPTVSMAFGTGGQAICAYPCWTERYQGRIYAAERVWGRIGALTGIEEEPGVPLSGPGGGTIVRGVLFLPGDRGTETGGRSVLLDACGRKVTDLHPGANDVRALAPGVYFIREGLGTGGEGLGKTRKVVVTR